MACGRCGIPRFAFVAEEALQTVERMLAIILAKMNAVAAYRGKEGGAFCVVDLKTGRFVIRPIIIGVVTDPEKRAKYLRLCVEKARRLRRKYMQYNHLLSWQSRNPDKGEWGGSICDGEYLWAFSGLPEEGDEALMLISAQSCGQIANGDPGKYAMISDNRVILDGGYKFWAKSNETEAEEPAGQPEGAVVS